MKKSYTGLRSAIVSLLFITLVSATKAINQIENMGSLASMIDRSKIDISAYEAQTNYNAFY